jgi:benzoate-CoA ligase
MRPDPVAPPARFNFAGHVLALNADRSERLAVIDDAGRITYGELADRIRRYAAVLSGLGLRSEERVLLLAYDGRDWLAAFLGALHAGIVPVAVNTLLTAGDYAYMLAHSGARAVIVSHALLPVLQAALQQEDHTVAALLVLDAEGALPTGCLDVARLVEATDPALRPAASWADDFAFWLYSSGSTGRPKAVVHTHANLYWTATLYGAGVLGLDETDRVFSAAKLYFAYGLGNSMTFPLSVGASIVLMAGRPTPSAVFERLVGDRPTVFCGSPTGYAGLLAAPDLPVPEKLALRLCLSAGEALPAELCVRAGRAFGCEIIDGIGSTEMLHIFLSNRPGDVRPGTTGRPVPGYALRLLNEAGLPATDGEIGDLHVQGPSAAVLYWRDRTRTTATFQGEWLHTGDKYVRDRDGRYTYAGRADDLLKVSGQFVSPIEVEGLLARHDQVLEAAVVGFQDATGLTRTQAFVALKPGGVGDATLAAALQEFVKHHLAPHKRPHRIEFLAELPKTATGKILRYRLRERIRP